MELACYLKELQAERKSKRKRLQKYEITNVSELTKPLTEMESEVVARVIIRWIIFRSEYGQKYEIRIRDANTQMTYSTQITNRKGALYVGNTREAPELNGRLLHIWASGVNYHMLTTDEIQRSVERANVVNRIKAEIQRAARILEKK